jgi:hypothetical protein
VINAMAASLSPTTLAELRTLAAQISTAPHGSSTELVRAYASRVGKNTNTIYTWLKAHTGFASGRKKRSDAGKTTLSGEAMTFIAAAKKEGLRANGCGDEHCAHQRHRDPGGRSPGEPRPA